METWAEKMIRESKETADGQIVTILVGSGLDRHEEEQDNIKVTNIISRNGKTYGRCEIDRTYALIHCQGDHWKINN